MGDLLACRFPIPMLVMVMLWPGKRIIEARKTQK